MIERRRRARRVRWSLAGFFRRRQDNQFLPAALEVLETPPSPIGISLLVAIPLLVLTAIAWAALGRIDVVAIAVGKVQPVGQVKFVQSKEPAKVAAIHVSNGQFVEAGDLLIEFDHREVEADEIALATIMSALKAEAIRRTAAIAAVRSGIVTPAPPITWEANIPTSIREREERVLASELAQLGAYFSGVAAQRRQKDAEADRLRATISAQEKLVDVLRQRVDMRASLVDRNAGTRSSVIDALESLHYHESILATQAGQLAENAAAVEVLETERIKAQEGFLANNALKLSEVERQLDEIIQRYSKARARLGYMRLVSPVAGAVQNLSVTTVGQIVAAGEELLRVVPTGVELEIECYLQNKDIGFIGIGQQAIVKVEAFPFTRYGTLNATVIRVGSDAIPQSDAQQIEANPATSRKGSGFAGGQRTQNLMFPVSLRADRTTMNIDGRVASVSAGMAVSVEIKTGSRRILEYLLSPLVQVMSEALRER